MWLPPEWWINRIIRQTRLRVGVKLASPCRRGSFSTILCAMSITATRPESVVDWLKSAVFRVRNLVVCFAFNVARSVKYVCN